MSKSGKENAKPVVKAEGKIDQVLNNLDSRIAKFNEQKVEIEKEIVDIKRIQSV